MNNPISGEHKCPVCDVGLVERQQNGGWLESRTAVHHDSARCRDVLLLRLQAQEAFYKRAVSELGAVLQPRNAQPWTLGDMVNAARELKQASTWEEDQFADEWTAAIKAAHPSRSESHEEYGIAMQMVGHRKSKWALLELVNWLLVSLRASREVTEAAHRVLQAFDRSTGMSTPTPLLDAIVNLRGAHNRFVVGSGGSKVLASLGCSTGEVK